MASDASPQSTPLRQERKLAHFVAHELPRLTLKKVREVSWEGSTQLVLVTRYELRGVRYRLVPAPRQATPTAKPDPWASELRPEGGEQPLGEVSMKLPGEGVYIDCVACGASGESPCEACAGTGMLFGGAGDGGHAYCPDCVGRGAARCSACAGSGGVRGEVTVWSRVGVHEEVRSIRSRSLPTDVAASLTIFGQPGDVVHHAEGRRLDDLVLPVGYRESAAAVEPVVDAARRLCESPGLEAGARILHQALEVRRIPVARLRMDDDSELWCWGARLDGAGPRIWPERGLETRWARLRRRLPAVGAAVFAIAGVLALLAGR